MAQPDLLSQCKQQLEKLAARLENIRNFKLQPNDDGTIDLQPVVAKPNLEDPYSYPEGRKDATREHDEIYRTALYDLREAALKSGIVPKLCYTMLSPGGRMTNESLPNLRFASAMALARTLGEIPSLASIFPDSQERE